MDAKVTSIEDLMGCSKEALIEYITMLHGRLEDHKAIVDFADELLAENKELNEEIGNCNYTIFKFMKALKKACDQLEAYDKVFGVKEPKTSIDWREWCSKDE